MQIPVAGSVYDLVKNMKLEMKWQERKNNLFKLKKIEEDPRITQLKEQAENLRKSNLKSSIDGKLKAGLSLTTGELDYIRSNEPDLYQKALEIERERKQYRKELESCKTKEDVERLKSRKMQGFITEANSIKSNPNIPIEKKIERLEQISRRMMAINNEHGSFIKTTKYAKLPTEKDKQKDKKKDSILWVDENSIDYLKEMKGIIDKVSSDFKTEKQYVESRVTEKAADNVNEAKNSNTRNTGYTYNSKGSRNTSYDNMGNADNKMPKIFIKV